MNAPPHGSDLLLDADRIMKSSTVAPAAWCRPRCDGGPPAPMGVVKDRVRGTAPGACGRHPCHRQRPRWCRSAGGNVRAVNPTWAAVLLVVGVVVGNCVLASALAIASVSSSDDVPQYPLGNSRLVWRFPADQACTGTVETSHKHLLFAGCNDHNLYALFRANGTERWSQTLPGRLHAKPVLRGGFVYAAAESGHILKYDTETGNLMWYHNAEPGTRVVAPVQFVADGILAAYMGPTIVLLEDETGEVLAQTNVDAPIESIPLLLTQSPCPSGTEESKSCAADAASVEIFVASNEGVLTSFTVNPYGQSETEVFRVNWRTDVGGRVDFQSGPVHEPTHDQILIGGYSRRLVALDRVTGGERWIFAAGDVVARAAVGVGDVDGLAFVGSSDKYMYALNVADGSVAWKWRAKHTIQSTPHVEHDGSAIVFGVSGKRVVALYAKDGSEKWQYETKGWIVGEVMRDRDSCSIYFSSFDKYIYRVGMCVHRRDEEL